MTTKATGSMDPPSYRPSARPEEATPKNRDGKQYSRSLSRPREQLDKLGQSSRALHKRRGSEVFLPPFENFKPEAPAQIITVPNPVTNPISTPQPGTTWTLSHGGTKSVIQEVHKVVLSDISTVEFFHARHPQYLEEPILASVGPGFEIADEGAKPTSHPNTVSNPTVPKEMDDPKTKKLAQKCLYRLEYRDEDDVLVYEKEGNIPADIKSPRRVDEPVMEVITTISVRTKSQANKINFNPELVKGTNRGTEIKINSPLLINALRAVVSYYPGFSLLEEPSTFQSPYKLLVHHRKDLEAYKDNHSFRHTAEYREECNQHIDILLEFLRQNFDGELELEEERHQQDPPVCTYEYLWMIFKPGVDIYTRCDADPSNSPRSVYVLSSTEGGHADKEINPYTLNFWNLKCDGENLRRTPMSAEIAPFDGEKEIRDLQSYPLAFMKENERKLLEERLIARGKRYYDYTAISHKHFHGYTLSNPRRLFDTRVILDTADYFADVSYDSRFQWEPLDEEKDKSIGVCGCSCTACSKTKNAEGKVRFAGYDRIPLKTSAFATELSDHQSMVCSPSIPGFSLKHRWWQTLDMDTIYDISFDRNAINDLVLEPEENKSLLKALAKRYAQMPSDVGILPAVIKDGVTVVGKSTNDPWAADLIEGKGEGQIILLHGPPGVGKTCTAESVAEFTERPLLSLSCSDIGTEPYAVEEGLKKWMKVARRWGAILLIDEADVYLEERTAQDFRRNSLVSVFLRNLEYYQGILFLTTNRVGVFDEAFSSRIHISMWYPGFDDVKRVKVWKVMIGRLRKERKDVKVPYDLIKYIEKDEDLKKVKWNGREIRNAFQTVVALAEYQAAEEGSSEIELKIDYLDQVVKMSRRFKDYLMTLPDGNVEKKALRYGKRNDEFTDK